MKRIVRAWLALSILFGFQSTASAYYVFSEDTAVATNVLVYQTCLPNNQLSVIYTSNLSQSWADPVMHLLKLTNGSWEEVGYGDNSFWGENPIISTTPTGVFSCSWHQIIVRAFDNNSGGSGGATFDLYINNDVKGTYQLGGYQVFTGTSVTPDETMETVLVNNGAAQTKLLRFEWDSATSHHKFSAMDTSSGLRGGINVKASKLSGSSSSNQQWVVASAHNGVIPGPVRVIRNAHGITSDTDLDGLSDILEAALGTCPSSNSLLAQCVGLADSRDTDGDGLQDGHEAIGIENPAPNTVDQLLYRWGARPLRKDVFVEIDYRDSTISSNPADRGVGAPLTENNAIRVAQQYRNLDLVQNLDGTTGVYVHFDNGGSCKKLIDFTTESSLVGDDEISEICGNFGGSSIISHTAAKTNEDHTECTLEDQSQCFYSACIADQKWGLSSIRDGVFHYAMGDSYGTGNGMTPGTTFCFNANGVFPNDFLAHELGHNMGIEHWGSNSSGILDRKPNYPSLMSYTYQDTGVAPNSFTTQFSRGEMGSLNPKNVSESSSYSNGIDVTNLRKLPWEPLFSEQSVGAQQFDWNRDGVWDSNVRANLLEPARYSGGADNPLIMGQTSLEAHTEVGVGAAYWPGTAGGLNWTPGTYSFINDDSVLKFMVDSSSSALPFGSIALHPESEPEAVLFEKNGTEQLLVFVAGPSRTQIEYTGWVPNGGAPVWTSIPNPIGVQFSSVSTAVLNGNLHLAAKNESAVGEYEVWRGWMSPAGVWSGWIDVSISSIAYTGPVTSAYTPALASAADGKLYLFAVGEDDPTVGNTQIDSGTLQTYSSFDPAQGAFWNHLSDPEDPLNQFAPTDQLDCELLGRPGAIYRNHLKTDGTATASGNGAFWLWYSVLCDGESKAVYRFTAGGFASGGPSANFSMGTWSDTPFSHAKNKGHCYDGIIAGAKMTLLQGPDHLQAVVPTGSVECPTNNIKHVPFADGQASVVWSDHNDHGQIEIGVCGSLGEANANCLTPMTMASKATFCE